MDFRKLVYFHYVATYQNLTKAAEECHIAQTAMSRYIASLEAELSFALFDRSHKHVTLTPAGMAFWEKTKQILDLYQNAVAESHDIANGFNYQLTVGYGGFERQLVIRYVDGFLTRYPKSSVMVYYYSYDEMLSHLLTNKCDVVFGPQNRLSGVANLRLVETYVSAYYLAVSSRNPLAMMQSMDAALMNDQTLVCPSEKGLYQDGVYEKLCTRLGFQPGKIIHTNSTQALLVMVELDLAMAIVPGYLLKEPRPGITLLPFSNPLPPEKLHVAAGFETREKLSVRLFLDYVAEARSVIKIDD